MRRWHIPAVFLLLIGGLFAMANLAGEQEIVADEAGIAKDRPWSGSAIELAGGKTYNLTVSPQAMCTGCQSEVRIELFRDTEPIVELETKFVAESAEVAATIVTFDFKAPSDGAYQPRFSLISSNGGGERLAYTVSQKPLLPLASWPLAVGLLLFLTLTAWTWASSDSELLEELSKLGAGSRIKVNGELGLIEMVTEFREEGYAPGIEFELRMDDGTTKFLAVDRFEEERSSEEHWPVFHVLMLSETLDGATLQSLQQQGPEILVQAMGDNWRLDENNSGTVRSVIYKVGSVFQSSQQVRVYSLHQMPFPKNPGDRWLEHIDYLDGDTEWAMMRIISPGDVDVIEATEHESVPDARLQQLAQMSRDARAARDRRDAAASQPQQQQQQQQWAQQPFGDNNG